MKEQNVEQLRERLPADREVQEAVALRAYEIIRVAAARMAATWMTGFRPRMKSSQR